MSDDPDKDYGNRYTWKEGDLVFLKKGHGEPMSEGELDAILARDRPDNAGRPGQPLGPDDPISERSLAIRLDH